MESKFQMIHTLMFGCPYHWRIDEGRELMTRQTFISGSDLFGIHSIVVLMIYIFAESLQCMITPPPIHLKLNPPEDRIIQLDLSKGACNGFVMGDY